MAPTLGDSLGGETLVRTVDVPRRVTPLPTVRVLLDGTSVVAAISVDAFFAVALSLCVIPQRAFFTGGCRKGVGKSDKDSNREQGSAHLFSNGKSYGRS